MDIQHQTVLITGGASGMGRASANLFLEQQAKVIVFDKSSAQWALAFSKEQLMTCEVDVTSESQVKEALTLACKTFGVPRVGVMCAGIAPAMRMVGKNGPAPFSHFEEVIRINLLGTINVMRLLSAEMTGLSPMGEAQERGVFIMTASIAAFEGQLGQAAYAASKGGIVSLTLPLAREFAQFGIRVMTIAPGLVDTPMFAGLNPDAKQSLAAAIPFPKALANPNHYAALASHIVQNHYLNGEVIRLDAALRM